MNDNFSIFETKFGENAIISFDLFDTLIEEPFAKHSDLFELMRSDVDKIIGKKNFDFNKVRQLAEKNALKQSKNKIIDINDIYSEFQRITQLGNAYVMEIEKLELVFIQKYYQTKPIGKQIYEIAQSLNKKIVILCDTYYPRFVIESILHKHEYRDYQEIFVSSEVNQSAQEGGLFTYMSEKLQCSSKYIIHIGDDEIADSVNPTKLGFNTLPLFSSLESYQQTLYYKKIWQPNSEHHLLSTRLINGLMAIKFFEMRDDKALDTDKSIFNNQYYRIGYFGLGPILLGYTQWILQKSQEDYVKHLYFLSSNGKFLKTAYETLSKHYSQAPTAYELLASSNIETFTTLSKNHELYEILDEDYTNIPIKAYFSEKFRFDIEPFNSLLERYGLNTDSLISKSSNEKQIEAIFDYLKPAIIEKNKNDYEYYSTYLKYQHLPNPDKSAIVDISNRDNTQVSVSDMVKQKVGGYYLFTFVDMIENVKKQDMPISGYVSNFEEKATFNCLLNFLFESSDNYFSHFNLADKMLNPVFDEKEYTKKTQEALEEIQKAALQFVIDFEQLYSKNINQLYFSSKQIYAPIFYFLNKDDEGMHFLKGINFTKVNPKSETIAEIDIKIDSSDTERNIQQDKSINIFNKIGKLFQDIKKTL